jgi:hypothetical protein
LKACYVYRLEADKAYKFCLTLVSAHNSGDAQSLSIKNTNMTPLQAEQSGGLISMPISCREFAPQIVSERN